MAAERFVIHGVVQGVGYRWWTVTTARRLGLSGWVRNRRDGTVELRAVGPSADIARLAEACRAGPPMARVTTIDRTPADDDGSTGFEQRGTV